MGDFMLMPKLDMSMEEGIITNWLYEEGAQVTKGEGVIEIETGKVNLEVETLVSGILLKKYALEGDTVDVNKPIAFIGEKGEEIPDLAEAEKLVAAEVGDEPEDTDQTIEAREEVTEDKEGSSVEDMADNSGNESNASDLVIIGGGPGGYVAAIRAAQLGADVTLIEKDELGGVCLNRGCIPTKSLVKNAGVMRVIENAEEMGIEVSDIEVDWKKVIERKEGVVQQLVTGVEGLLNKNNVQVIKGEGKILTQNRIEVKSGNGSKKVIEADNIIIATGTSPARIPIKKDQDVEIMNTDQALSLDSLPESLVIIGGGVIGVEMASIFASFGVKVSIIEIMDSLVPMVDNDVSLELKNIFENRGIKVYTGNEVKEIKKSADNNQLMLSDNNKVEAEEVLLAVGRKPDNSAFAELNLRLDGKGYIQVDEKMQTNLEHVFAIGDITGKVQLAHVASRQGIIVAENLFGKEAEEMSYNAVPNCIFTDPEIASVGMSEDEVQTKHIPYKTANFPFAANGKSLAMGNSEGFVKIIADERWDEILGVHIMGPHASDLIAEATLAMTLEATAEELAQTIHAHPTLSETVMEAAEGIYEQSIHI